jgi:hypothetical protein
MHVVLEFTHFRAMDTCAVSDEAMLGELLALAAGHDHERVLIRPR